MDRGRRHQHRTLQPQGAQQQQPAHSSARLADSLECIRQEFEALSQDANLARSQRDDLENNISGQVNELNIIRQSLYELETSHAKMRQDYDAELARLRQENMLLRQGAASGPPPTHPPAGLGLQSGKATPAERPLPPPGQQPLPQPPPGGPAFDPYFNRDRERERERDRERDREAKRIKQERRAERDRERPITGPGRYNM